jgi:hypothetical protein
VQGSEHQGRPAVQWFGGEGEIRTHEGREAPPVFKTGAFNRSATSPESGNSAVPDWPCPAARFSTSGIPRRFGRTAFRGATEGFWRARHTAGSTLFRRHCGPVTTDRSSFHEGNSLGQHVSSTPPGTQGNGRVEVGHAPGVADRGSGGPLEDNAGKSRIHAARACQTPRHAAGRLSRRTSCPHWMPSSRAGSRLIPAGRRCGNGRFRLAYFPRAWMRKRGPPWKPEIGCYWKSRPTVRTQSPARMMPRLWVIHGIRLRPGLSRRRRLAGRWTTGGG